MFNQVTIIGVGLIGGSLGMGVRARGLARTVMGVGRDESRLRQGVDGGALDYFTTDLGTGVTGADLVIIAVPVGMIVTMLQKALPYLKPGAIVTDVGSCKAAIVKAVEAIMPPDVHFVGGHPMAGSEQVGIGAANRYLFEGAYYIFTPTSHTDQEALRQVSTLARNLGCRVLEMDPQDHDRAVAAVSHLPHLLASTLVNTVGRIPGSEQALLLAAGGYRDTTRVAAGSPEMWRDILLTNREMVRAMINEFRTELDTIERTLAEGDPDQI
ncbi:MAG: prephenate dehydrogenase, partial [Candidatus Desulforudis sp.]|nr:prephenate dehydrogenase [Desulforudis sp.]